MTYTIQVAMITIEEDEDGDEYTYCEILEEIYIEEPKISLIEFENILAKEGYIFPDSAKAASGIIEALYHGKCWVGCDVDGETYVFANGDTSYEDMQEALGTDE